MASKGLPPGGTPAFEELKNWAAKQGDGAPDVLFRILEDGHPGQQEVAMITLRCHGIEVWEGQERSEATFYIIREPLEESFRTLVPKQDPNIPTNPL